MARPRAHLRNAPIVEAVIDFRVSRREQLAAETFAGLGGSVGERYESITPMHSFEARFGVDPGQLVNAPPVQQTVGWIYRAGTEIAQFRSNGFTFSKTEPYTAWGEVFGEAFRLWEVYIRVAEPQQVSRIAVRYINRMRLTTPTGLAEYLTAPPVLPPPTPQVLREFLTRIYVEDETRSASAVVIQALEPRVDSSEISMLLDIDAFREVSVAPDDTELPVLFERLRQLKNDVFFASITEKTAEIYE